MRINLKRCISRLFWILSKFLILLLFCEYVIYYLVIGQCYWPKLDDKVAEKSVDEVNSTKALRAIFLADIHLLGPYRGHWFDKLRREWQMYRAFQTAVTMLKPDVVFILGDLFDEGQWCDQAQFEDYITRMSDLFYVPPKTKLYVVPGNHDVGFHYKMRADLIHAFNKVYNTSEVKFLHLKGIYFILINSMAMHRDGCYFCDKAEAKLKKIAEKLNCLKEKGSCHELTKLKRYTRPIVLQHFPMYRKSDSICNERDEAPEEIKNVKFKERWDCLSEEASNMIYDMFNPRLIFTGHTHHGCGVIHREDIVELTIPSFSWRNKNNPTFTMGVLTPSNYALNKCDLPRESTVILLYAIVTVLIVLFKTIKLNQRSGSKERRMGKLH